MHNSKFWHVDNYQQSVHMRRNYTQWQILHAALGAVHMEGEIESCLSSASQLRIGTVRAGSINHLYKMLEQDSVCAPCWNL